MVLTSAIEVGIAIAGFTGIVIALSRRDPDANARALLVSILLLTSIGSVAFAFLPMLLSIAGLEDASVWCASSSAFLVYVACVFTYRGRQLGAVRPRSSAPVIVGGSLFFAGVLLQIPNAIWWRAAWPYLVLIVAYVLYSFSVFVALVWDVWRETHEESALDRP